MQYESERIEYKSQMIKESDGDTYENARCLQQNLSFHAAEIAFDRYGVEFSAEKYRALGITQNDIYTNLALLLSDQCHHTTKIAVFKDEFCTEFRDSKEFSGSVFKQFEDAVNYLALCNKTTSTIKGVVRTDKYENCPVQPSIEATTNAFKIVLPNMNASGAIAESTPEASEKAPVAITPQMKTVMDYLISEDV